MSKIDEKKVSQSQSQIVCFFENQKEKQRQKNRNVLFLLLCVFGQSETEMWQQAIWKDSHIKSNQSNPVPSTESRTTEADKRTELENGETTHTEYE